MAGSPKAAYVAWSKWMEDVPQTERQKVADFIRSCDLGTPEGVTKLTQEMMALVAEGRLPPIISNELRDWVSIVHEQMVAIHLATGAKADTNILLQFNKLVEDRDDIQIHGVIDAKPFELPQHLDVPQATATLKTPARIKK